MPNSVTPNMPAKTAVPSVRRISAPAPSDTISGTTPRMNAKLVMMIGRSRSLTASSVASRRERPDSRWACVGVDGGGRVHVVPRDHGRAAHVAGGGEVGEGHHFALTVPHLEVPDVLGRLPVDVPRLHVHLPGAAEAVKVVDVIGADRG